VSKGKNFCSNILRLEGGFAPTVDKQNVAPATMKTLFRLFAIVLTLEGYGTIAEAQQPKKVPWIGYLASGDPATASAHSEPIRQALRALGYIEGQNIATEYRYAEGKRDRVEGIPFQFLPAHNDLLVEALTEACEVFYEQTPTRVVRAEHLVAIALQTGRDKDRERVRLLREEAMLDRDYLAGVLTRHGLEARWKQWTP
jgi:hypothetical protein